MTSALRTFAAGCALAALAVSSLAAQQPPAAPPAAPAPAPASAAPPNLPEGVTPPDDYVIGPQDVLVVVFWRDKDMSSDVTVRPDGKITLPLINDIQAAGLTPDQLRMKIATAAARFIEDPAATVIVKTINSRKVYITGQVGKSGPYDLIGPMSVLQLIAMAGGLGEFANKKDIVIMRTENGKPTSYTFDYEAVSKRTKLQQNILLKPGDTVVVP